jgi:Mor family transcriptional regulator
MVKAAQPKTDTHPTQSTPAPNDADVFENDIIEDIFAAVIAMAPQFKAELNKIKHAKREQWAGDRPYIAHRAGDSNSPRNIAIKKDYWQGGERIPLLERRYGLSKARLWQIIKS